MDQSKTPNKEQEPVKEKAEDPGLPGASKYSSHCTLGFEQLSQWHLPLDPLGHIVTLYQE